MSSLTNKQIKGVQYKYNRETKELFDYQTKQKIGTWDEETREIIPTIQVKKITINDIMYFMDDNKVLYNPETKEKVGIWDLESRKILPLPDDEDEDEDEDEDDEDEVAVSFSANIGGEIVDFRTQLLTENIRDLPSDFFISVLPIDINNPDNIVRYVVSKKEKKIKPEGILVEGDEDTKPFFIEKDEENPVILLQEVGRKFYRKLSELGFALELEEEEEEEYRPNEIVLKKKIEKAKQALKVAVDKYKETREEADGVEAVKIKKQFESLVEQLKQARQRRRGGKIDIGKKLRRGFRPVAKQLSKANPLAYKPVQSLGAKLGDITNNYLLPAAVSAGKPLLDASLIAASTALTGNPFLGQVISDVVWEEGVEKTGIDPRERQKSKELGLLSGLAGEAGASMFGGAIPDDPELYAKAKAFADNIYKKPSAYKSGFIIKKYKELGGTYSGKKPSKTGIARWMKEEWKDIGNQEYPVYRPTLKITEKTPLTPDEIDPVNLKQQIALKQKIKGDANLPPFEKKGGKLVSLVSIEDIPKTDAIWEWSNPNKVAEKAKEYLGKNAVIFRADKPKKKYMVFDPNNEKWIYFGEMSYQDHTKHNDPIRRENYLRRTANMKGDWKNNRYSANNLSRNILW